MYVFRLYLIRLNKLLINYYYYSNLKNKDLDFLSNLVLKIILYHYISWDRNIGYFIILQNYFINIIINYYYEIYCLKL